MDDKRYIGELRKYEWIGGLCFLAFYLTGGLPWILNRLLPLVAGPSDPLRATILLNLAADAVSLLILIPLLRRYLRSQFRLLLDNGWRPVIQLVSGALLMFLAMIVLGYLVAFVAAMYPEYSNGNQEIASRLFAAYPAWGVVLSCVTAPVIEELMFRGVVFCGLWRHSAFWAYLLSALLFAFPHVSAYLLHVPLAVTLVNLSVYFTFGLILARTYARSGSILTSIFLHAAYNCFIQYLNR